MSALLSRLRSTPSLGKGLDDKHLTLVCFPVRVEKEEKEKNARARKKKEVTDAKRANRSTLPCSGDKTHTESTHTHEMRSIKVSRRRVESSEV